MADDGEKFTENNRAASSALWLLVPSAKAVNPKGEMPRPEIYLWPRRQKYFI
jgi:hypothetical protein